jgi:hypothetical protein
MYTVTVYGNGRTFTGINTVETVAVTEAISKPRGYGTVPLYRS